MLDARDITQNPIYWSVCRSMTSIEYLDFIDSIIDNHNNLNRR